MKKLVSIIILSLFLLSLAACAGPRQGPDQPIIGGALSTFGSMVEYILGGIFGAISKNPSVWLRFLAFIAIFAVLNKVLILHRLLRRDTKTRGILAFVVALGTAAATPIVWYIFALTMYSGIVIIAMLGYPAWYLCKKTYKIWKTPYPAYMNIIAVIGGWILYLVIVSTMSYTLFTMASYSPEWRQIANTAATDTIIRECIGLIQLLAVLATISLIVKMFLSHREKMATTRGGRTGPTPGGGRGPTSTAGPTPQPTAGPTPQPTAGPTPQPTKKPKPGLTDAEKKILNNIITAAKEEAPSKWIKAIEKVIKSLNDSKKSLGNQKLIKDPLKEELLKRYRRLNTDLKKNATAIETFEKSKVMNVNDQLNKLTDIHKKKFNTVQLLNNLFAAKEFLVENKLAQIYADTTYNAMYLGKSQITKAIKQINEILAYFNLLEERFTRIQAEVAHILNVNK